jgi:3-oxoacyl-(acyl-carrier-protein) synthase
MKRVVVTGLGIVSPNGIGLDAFTHAIKNGVSGVKFDQQLADLEFSCRIRQKDWSFRHSFPGADIVQ